jgi:hypothetical protein
VITKTSAGPNGARGPNGSIGDLDEVLAADAEARQLTVERLGVSRVSRPAVSRDARS